MEVPAEYPLKGLVDKLPEDHPFRLFRNFARVIWKHLNLPEPTPVQLDFCDYLQFGPTYLQIQAFRGAGKTYITTAYYLWRLYINPDEIILIVSAAKDTADQICRFGRRLIEEIDFLNHLAPNKERGDQDSAVSFQVGCATPKKSPSVTSKGMTSALTGGRASLVILDDVEIPNNSLTPMLREQLVTRIEEISAILLPVNEELDIYPTVRVLGTPQSTHTIYRVLETKGYETRVWPIMKPDPDVEANYGVNVTTGEYRLADMIRKADVAPGTPMEPTRFTAIDIAERKMKYSLPSFMRQFMLSTDLSDEERFPLKIRDLIMAEFPEIKAREIYVHSNDQRNRIREFENPGLPGDGFFRAGLEEGQLVPFDNTIMAVDPSGRGKDETGIAVISTLSGYIFIHSVRGIPGGYSQPTLEAIAREAKKYRVNTVVVESNFGDGAFTELLKPVLQKVYTCGLEEVRVKHQKELRIIEALGPPMQSHRVVCHTRVVDQQLTALEGDSADKEKVRQLFWQMTHLEEERGCLLHDDRIDALALAFGHVTQNLALDAAREKRQRELDDLDEWIKEHDAADDGGWCSATLGSPSSLF